MLLGTEDLPTSLRRNKIMEGGFKDDSSSSESDDSDDIFTWIHPLITLLIFFLDVFYEELVLCNQM